MAHTTRTYRSPHLASLAALLCLAACGPEVLEPELRPAEIVLGESQVDFAATEDADAPDPVTIEISNGGEQPLNGLTVQTAYAGDVTDWLALELSSTSAPATLFIGLRSNELAAGEWEAQVTIRASSAPDSPKVLLVRASVEPSPPRGPPAIQLSAESIRFEADQLAGDLPASVVQITNGGGEPLSGLSVAIELGDTEQPMWLAAELSHSTAPASIELLAGTDTLRPGTYDADVVISADGIADRRLPVEMLLRPLSGHLRLASPSLNLESNVGDPNPPVHFVEILNDSVGAFVGLGATVIYPAGGPGDWLDANIYDNEFWRTLSVGLRTSQLPEGTHTAQIEVTADNAHNEPAILEVTVTVSEPAAFLHLGTGNVYVEAEYGGGSPAALEISVANLSVGTIENLTASVSPRAGSEGDWVSVSLAGTTAPTTLTLTLDISALNAGAYYADLTVDSPDAGNGPQTRRITLVLTGGEADLTLIGAPLPSQTVLPGGTFDVPAYTIANIGSRQTEFDFQIGMFLSEDRALTSDDTYLTGASWSWLAPGEEIERPAGTFTLPADTPPGTYMFGFIVNYNGAVEESDLTNNSLGTVIVVPSG